MRYDIWYMRPEWFRSGILGEKPDPADLIRTHIPVKAIHVEAETPNPLQYVYHQMQGEVWSPNGEARDLISGKGLGHTSMSVGDVAVDENGVVHVVASFGFKTLS